MGREELQRASDSLQVASEGADSEEAETRLTEHADRLAELASADTGPDHGTLARVERQVSRVADGAGGDVEDHVEEAVEHVHAYREDLEGV